MNNVLLFSNRAEFRKWLTENCLSADGVWLLFGKHGNPKTVKADEALEEALCFGWIDGQMQSIDIQAVWFYETGKYIKSKTELQQAINPPSAVIDTALALKDGAPVQFEKMSELVLNWAKAVIGGYSE